MGIAHASLTQSIASGEPIVVASPGGVVALRTMTRDDVFLPIDDNSVGSWSHARTPDPEDDRALDALHTMVEWPGDAWEVLGIWNGFETSSATW